MKKSHLILIFLFIICSSFSQTKKETENWINKNINGYSVDYGNNPINIVENIYIENGYLYFYYHWKREDENYYDGTWSKVALKYIKSIEYSYDKSPGLNNKWIELHLNFTKGKCFQGKLDDEFQGKDNVAYEVQSERNIITQRLNMDFVKSGMKKRIEKALLSIIKQYGGNASLKKEAF
ncbi:hypothetical protein [Flavobacterium taihuense]|uniref:Uncharacterized protein n=1 Tax=Flavobacterium taihuense TaxID=2857508 RepID=A0ABS6Y1E1_9FLAO|nr:hypothetical protein [Flavobacterium taihuense]MBW4362745.1 hypothetical protein [Flavobacterium taihuense]